MGGNTKQGAEGSRCVQGIRKLIREVVCEGSPRARQSDVDVRDWKYLGVLLEDTTTESGLTNTWENVWDIISRYTKRGQWLSDEEKRTTELTLRPRFVAEDHQPRPRDTTTEKGIEVTAVEQILK